jgi:hypothetical protein
VAYYINLFTEETWQESRVTAEWRVTGHTERLRNRDKIVEGDVFLCWLTKVSAFVGALSVRGPAFEVGPDAERIWKKALYPLRFSTELAIRVPIAHGVTLAEVRAQSTDPALWGWIFRNSGNEIPANEADWILATLQSRPRLGPLDPEPTAAVAESPEPTVGRRRDTGHAKMQLELALLARNAGLDVWIAQNDRSTIEQGQRLGDLSVERLPDGLPEDVLRTIALIDVVWLKRNRYIAAFEVEASTPIFTGLQRMGDLMAAIPNLQIPLFVLAPDEKRPKVFAELTRPLFRFGLDPPLEDVCRYISFESLDAAFAQFGTSSSVDARRLIEEIAEGVE